MPGHTGSPACIFYKITITGACPPPLQHGTSQVLILPRHAQTLRSSAASARDYSPQGINNSRMKCVPLTQDIDGDVFALKFLAARERAEASLYKRVVSAMGLGQKAGRRSHKNC